MNRDIDLDETKHLFTKTDIDYNVFGQPRHPNPADEW